jgi:hypothetical protein
MRKRPKRNPRLIIDYLSKTSDRWQHLAGAFSFLINNLLDASTLPVRKLQGLQGDQFGFPSASQLANSQQTAQWSTYRLPHEVYLGPVVFRGAKLKFSALHVRQPTPNRHRRLSSSVDGGPVRLVPLPPHRRAAIWEANGRVLFLAAMNLGPSK